MKRHPSRHPAVEQLLLLLPCYESGYWESAEQLRAALGGLEGVRSIRLDVRSRAVIISFDPHRVTAADLRSRAQMLVPSLICVLL